ncbi:Crp/Fnr family transcriptional regulator [Parasulfitobacter algicola]|uniref:Crp/Fnr family transcriptional regulator n=1 Tax=Parasulfitobacter algicola TaxID=2614809 RepID=A0ABX2IL98_9RHOB|nr:Crp/Fnr family transcriptional regulator [Sulfitobacter algicola]NSX53642.1 Crp/Fnr family transcriptional regulator [Sulfitobacter algicola]
MTLLICEPSEPDTYHIPDFSLFAGLDQELCDGLSDDVVVTSYKPGQIIIEEGELSRDIYLVLSGKLVGLLLSENGKEVSYTEITKGSYFGEISALDGRPRSITISAETDCKLGRISHAVFQKWMVAHPVILQNLAINLAQRNRALTERIYGLVVHDVEKRVCLYLSRLAQSKEQLFPGGVLQPAATHEAMAAFIGANREAVSRVIARLSRKGVIEASRKKIVFRDIRALLD